ncbi:hypothetical protein L4D76_00330 [Photobacterium sagamiensis]|uniref:hypothetical protein n=1 Tax=Photobacterium sagamiensis TaxID=2910241 RepID=UPI003D150664
MGSKSKTGLELILKAAEKTGRMDVLANIADVLQLRPNNAICTCNGDEQLIKHKRPIDCELSQ